MKFSCYWNLSQEEESQFYDSFKAAQHRLKEVFPESPYPRVIESCPCCTTPYEKSPFHLKDKDLGRYLAKAMTTWGNEEDFKLNIYKLFSFVFLEKNLTYAPQLFSKLSYVENWSAEEMQVIATWIHAYARYTYFREFSQLLTAQRHLAKQWLNKEVKTPSFHSPLTIFHREDFEDLVPFIQPHLIEKFSTLLDVWPQGELDFIIYAFSLKEEILFFTDEQGSYKDGIFFREKKALYWVSKNMDALQTLFFTSTDSRLQSLFSEAYELSGLILGILK